MVFLAKTVLPVAPSARDKHALLGSAMLGTRVCLTGAWRQLS